MQNKLRSQNYSLYLKSTAPLVTNAFLNRLRLQCDYLKRGTSQVFALLAPTGFGKTSQLGQWRRDALANGALAIWYSVDKNDQPLRLIQGLTYSAKESCGNLGFSEEVIDWIEQSTDPHVAITTWLAEIARISRDIFLILDDVDLMPSSSLSEILPYLLGNAPTNLRIAISAQPSGTFMASEALAPSNAVLLQAADLKFDLEETKEALNFFLEELNNPDTAVRLHELTEGWPLGVQLAATTLRRGNDPESLFDNARSDLRRYFLDTIIARQPKPTVDMLIRLSQFDLLQPQLCNVVLERTDADIQILRLQSEYPLLVISEVDDWIRLHPFARKILQEKLTQLPETERQKMSLLASNWFAERQMYEEAAEQAFLAKDTNHALTLIEPSIRIMAERGKGNTILHWHQHMSLDELKKHPGFWAPMGWALALTDKCREAETLVNLILAQSDTSEETRFEASLIMVYVQAFADRLDRVEEIIEQWETLPDTSEYDFIILYAAAKAAIALNRGEPDQAKLLTDKAADAYAHIKLSPVAIAILDFYEASALLWQGRYAMAVQKLKQALAKAEDRMGRRSSITTLLAALLGLAYWETGQNEEAELVLAGRISILERHCPPEAMMAAYKTLARLADDAGRQDQALSLLDSLHAIGRSRGQIRLQALALTETVKLHARYCRTESARSAAKELQTLIEENKANTPEMFNPWLQLCVEMALSHTNLISGETGSYQLAKTHAENAATLALTLKRKADFVEARLTLSQAIENIEADHQSSMFADTYSLAKAEGMTRLLHQYKPYDTSQASEATAKQDQTDAIPQQKSTSYNADPLLLTPKELEVVLLLNQNFSNKEIARTMSISAETVKWHIKNLFNKLQASNRKHAVARAKMLGIF